jgi:hypothetical protein
LRWPVKTADGTLTDPPVPGMKLLLPLRLK